MPERKIRVMIAEDDTALRRSLVELLNLEEDLVVVSNVGNGAQALAEAGVLKPDVILTDIDMPQVTGIELTREIRKMLPDLAVVVLTKFGDDDNVFSAIKAGAIGYVLKDSGFSEIAGAVRMAVNGEGFLSPAIVGKVLFEFKGSRSQLFITGRLSPNSRGAKSKCWNASPLA